MPYTPYTDLSPLPIGANPLQWARAANWNPLVSHSSAIHNIVTFGALSAADPNDPSQAVFDCTPAFEAAIAAWNQRALAPAFPGVNGGIYVPEGNWYISRPLLIPAGCQLFGDGPSLSIILVGPGTPATPNLVQGFGGPAIYICTGQTPAGNFPTYTAPLVGGVGQSMVLTSLQSPVSNNPLFLHDSYPWSIFLGTWYPQSSLCLRFWVNVNETLSAGSTVYKAIIGSRGPDIWGPDLPPEIALGVYAVSDDGITLHLRAYLTTAPSWTILTNPPAVGTQTIINSSAIAINTPVNVEVDYNGSFFDFYVNGVNQGHVATSGPVLRAPWEGVTIGMAGPEFSPAIPSITGAIDSIELSSIARHTGTGSFTPPIAKYVGDSNTMALYNWDQPAPPTGWPFVVGQTAIPIANFTTIPPSVRGLVPHYIRTAGGGLSDECWIHDIQVASHWCGSGIVGFGADRCLVQRVYVQQPCQYGLKLSDPYSFFSKIEDYNVNWAGGVGLESTAEVHRVNSVGCPIDIQILAGKVDTVQAQPSYHSYAPIIAGPGFGPSSPIFIQNCVEDFEVFDYLRLRAGGLILGSILGSLTSINNFWGGAQSSSAPPVMYITGVPESGFATHIGDTFSPTSTSSVKAIQKYGAFNGNVMLQNCSYFGPSTASICNAIGFVTQFNGTQINNQTGLSTSDTQANNLAGTFTLLHGFTTGGPIFATPEPDGRYNVVCTVKNFNGSAPAAGSTTVTGYTTGPLGFVVTVGADPGGTCQLNFSYHLIRTHGDPLLFSYLPAIPSSFANPLVTVSPTGDFAVGITIIPTLSAFVLNYTNSTQTIVEAGTPSTNWWTLALAHSAQSQDELGTLQLFFDSFVKNGQLYGLANPGVHNVVLGKKNGLAFILVDGGNLFSSPQAVNTGTQGATIHVGEHAGGTQTLTVATLRNLKVDTTADQVITNEPNAGPGVKPQGMFFGDQMTIGTQSTSANGGFATQIANNRYATKYYWFAGTLDCRVLDNIFTSSIVKTFWGGWGQNQTASIAVCFMAGFNDILNGATAASVWAGLQSVLDGAKATATFNPPVLTTGFPTNNFAAWAEFIPPTSGSATCVINGVSFTSTFSVNGQTTCNNLITQIQANGPTMAIVTPSLLFTNNTYAVQITAVATGAQGNGITTTTDGANGAFWYPGFTTQFGQNVTCVINGVSFIANFHTDANTTVNDLIARINLSAPTLALVTPTNVGGTLKLTAVAIGGAGNSITTTTNSLCGASWQGPPFPNLTMTGGVNGAVPMAIPVIVLCNVPPFGNSGLYTAGKDAQRVTLNASIATYVAAHPGVVTLADVDLTLRDPAAHQNMLPAYLSSDNTNPNNAGHTALFGLINPLLP